MNNAAQAIDQNSLVPTSQPNGVLTPMEVLGRAVAAGASTETLEKLMGLQERWEKNEARKAFDEAIAAARLEFKPINKNRQVGYEAKTPGAARTDYRHEDLAEIARSVDPILGKHGLSYRWRTLSPVNEPITVTCIVSHRLGHSEENSLSAGRDDSGKKNGIQQIGSTITYLQRYTLKAALGLAASNDDDGKSSGNGAAISSEQVEAIGQLIKQSQASVAKFCTHMKVECIEDIPAAQFETAVTALKNFAAKKGGAS